MGFNGAARDPLQHALPLVYIEPARALSVLRNTCAWATPDGDLPYALDAAKRPTNLAFRPSDQNLWALWLAAEYAAATGDLAAFDEPLPYHPSRATAAVPLREHLRRQFRFFVDVVGRGERGHVRILNADWNDVAIADSGVDREVMIERGGSVLNSAMAAWVLPVFAGLAERLGDTALAAEARAQADELRELVAAGVERPLVPPRLRAGRARPSATRTAGSRCSPGRSSAARPTRRRPGRCSTRSIADTAPASPLGARLRWPSNPDLVDGRALGRRHPRRHLVLDQHDARSGPPPASRPTWPGTSGGA